MRLLQRNAEDLQETVERTRSLRRSRPQVDVAESIYSRDDCLSIYPTRDSMLASSEVDFDFDDVVVDSAVYRRVLTAAKRQGEHQNRNEPNRELIDDVDNDRTEQEDIFVVPKVLSKKPSWQLADDRDYLVRNAKKTASPILPDRSQKATSRVSTKQSDFEEIAASVIEFISKHVSDGMYSEGIRGAAVLIAVIGTVFKALDAANDRQPNVSRLGNKRSHLL
jgi:hypothetical protein